jgi:hypothetical protein
VWVVRVVRVRVMAVAEFAVGVAAAAKVFATGKSCRGSALIEQLVGAAA